MKTLENIQIEWLEEKKNFKLPYSKKNASGSLVFTYRTDEEVDGLAYGCSPEEAPFVFEYLYEEGLIRNYGEAVRVSAKGIVELDRLQRGELLSVRQGFLIRRWDTDLDTFLNPVMEEVGNITNCPIQPVWGEEHNDRIDERIFRKIKEASLVVVDISPDRFNVGFELGYAYALGKPIVVIREKPKKGVPEHKKRIPFDIQTMNCYDYDRTDEGARELVDKLVARVQMALDSLAPK